MHFQSPRFPHSKHFQSDPHLESGRKTMVELFCGNSQCVTAVSCFRRGAPSLMFDGILNPTLFQEKVFTTGVTQGNLKLLPLNSPNSHQHKYNKMKS